MENPLEGTGNKLNWVDFTVIGLYFAFVLAVGLYSSYKSKRSSVKGYFLASRSMRWPLVGASLFGTNIGSGHFIGFAGSAAASGIGIACYEIHCAFLMVALGWIFVPVYMASGVYTMPEYIRLRFGGQRIRMYLAVLAMILYVLTKISPDLYAGALFIQLALDFGGDLGLYGSIMVLLVIAAIFTVAGGLTAVMWTDFVQTILMITGAFILMCLSLNEVGGYHELMNKFMYNSEPKTSLYDIHTNRSCGLVPEDSLHLLRDFRPGKSDLPWTGIVFGQTVAGLWYVCTDQVMVQRMLASKNMINAKGGCILAGYLKLLPLYLLILPGMAARVLYTDRVGCADPEVCTQVCGSETGCTNIAYAELVIKLMPRGLSGMMLAVMMAALMSSLTSVFNSTSTIFTMDIWTRIRKNASETELLIVGRAAVVVLLGISVVWVPILNNLHAPQLFVYIQSVSNFLAPPVTALFLLAIFVPRTNESGAFWGLMVGLALGLTRFILEFAYTVPPCGSTDPDLRPDWIKTFVGDVHYLHYGFIMFIISGLTMIVVSLCTKPIEEDRLHRLTFWSRRSIQVRKPMGSELAENAKDLGELTKASPQQESQYPQLKKLLSFLCGVNEKAAEEAKAEDEQGSPSKLSPEEEAAEAAKFLDETKFWRRFVNGNAVLLMIIAILFFALYG